MPNSTRVVTVEVCGHSQRRSRPGSSGSHGEGVDEAAYRRTTARQEQDMGQRMLPLP